MAFRILLGTILPVLVYAVVVAPGLWCMEGHDREAGGLLILFVVILCDPGRGHSPIAALKPRSLPSSNRSRSSGS